MTLYVHYQFPPDEKALAQLLEQLDDNIVLSCGPDQAMLPETNLLIAGKPRREEIDEFANLQTLVIPWAGVPEETRNLMLDYPHIAVHNLHHNAAPVAELAVALLLASAKWVVPMDSALRTNDWTARYQPPRSMLLLGKTALILGYGAIGRCLAPMCKALGMRVIALRRRPDAFSDGVADEIHPPTKLAELLARSQILFNCLPLTPATTGLVGAKQLDLLPDQSIVVNVGRGAVIDERALYEALRDKKLHGAGLDVWYNYPADTESRSATPPSRFPFCELDNVVMSPHRAGSTAESNLLRMDHLARLLNMAARGAAIPNRVNVGAGY